MLAQLREEAAALKLPFGRRTMTFNSRLAQELGKWAETQGRGDAFHCAVFRAYFARGENIARPAVLTGLAAQAGLNPVHARRVLANRSQREAVEADWQRAGRLDIRAVPTWLMGGRRLVGARTYGVLEKWLIAAGVGRRSDLFGGPEDHG